MNKYQRTFNKNARIKQFRLGTTIQTATYYRDDSFEVVAKRDTSGRQAVLVSSEEGAFELSGAQARTLYRVLDRHYAAQHTDSTYQKLQLSLDFK